MQFFIFIFCKRRGGGVWGGWCIFTKRITFRFSLNLNFQVRLEHILERIALISEAANTERPSSVTSSLFIGGSLAARSVFTLQHLGITHILCLCSNEIGQSDSQFPDLFEYRNFSVRAFSFLIHSHFIWRMVPAHSVLQTTCYFINQFPIDCITCHMNRYVTVKMQTLAASLKKLPILLIMLSK